MKKLSWLIVILSLLMVFLAGIGFEKRWLAENIEPEVVVETKIVEVERIAGYDWRYSDEDVMSIYEAIVFTEGNIRSHQYYLDHPELQNAGTGDSSFNERVIKQYQRLKSLLLRLEDGPN